LDHAGRRGAGPLAGAANPGAPRADRRRDQRSATTDRGGPGVSSAATGGPPETGRSELLRPRLLVHRGVVLASGLLLDEALPGAPEGRRGVVRGWCAGATLHRVGCALVLTWPVPRRVVCAQAPGTPLVAVGGALLAAPLSEREREALAPPAGSLVIVDA